MISDKLSHLLQDHTEQRRGSTWYLNTKSVRLQAHVLPPTSGHVAPTSLLRPYLGSLSEDRPPLYSPWGTWALGGELSNLAGLLPCPIWLFPHFPHLGCWMSKWTSMWGRILRNPSKIRFYLRWEQLTKASRAKGRVRLLVQPRVAALLAFCCKL